MLEFTLYTSGIALAKFNVTEESILCAVRADDSLLFPSFSPFTKAQNETLYSRTHLDVQTLFSRLPLLQAAIRNGSEQFTLSGAQYQKSRDGVYLQRNIKYPCNLFYETNTIYAFVCPGREICNILVQNGYEHKTPLSLWTDYNTRPLYAITPPQTITTPMRDGICLAADVYLPQHAPLPLPVILMRTPYDKDRNAQSYLQYVRRGYAVVIQDVRGRNESEGEWQPFVHEIEDGDDTLTFLANQPFCNGNIGMLGASYLGYVQWCAAASGNPHLKAMVSIVTAGSAFVDGPMPGGCCSSGSFAWNFAMTQKRFAPERMQQPHWDDLLDVRPLTTIATAAFEKPVPFLTKQLTHMRNDAFWQKGDWASRYGGQAVPVFIQSGWFDDNGMGTTQGLQLSQDWPRKVILGPWQHSGNSQYDLHALSFPENALRFDLDLLHLQWFDYFLRGEENGIDRTAPIEYYTTGENTWKTADTWPISQADTVPFYLGENGGLFPISGRCGQVSYTYDPQNPATHLIDMCENEIAVPEEYTLQEQRPDYLKFTSPILSNPLTVTGDAAISLWISSNVPDTDFVVRLCDVDENGHSISLTHGVLAARFRNGFEQEEFLPPDKPVLLSLRTGKISHQFARGHSLRITVTSSAKNLIFPHTNTKDTYNGIPQIAHNVILYGGETASCVTLHLER